MRKVILEIVCERELRSVININQVEKKMEEIEKKKNWGRKKEIKAET